jgi:hypothetical protein
MRFNLIAILIVFSVLALHPGVKAQENATAAETLDELRVQLLEVQAKEESLRMRAQQLDEDLKPENIERALAGIGSTKPEELREHRRRLLTIERDGVRAQLKILEMNRSHLEAAVVSAEGKAYQESAIPMPPPPLQMFAGNSFTLIGALVTISVALLLILLVAVIEVSTTRRKRVG